MSIRLLQLTDLHLFRERDGLLAGVRTWDTFAAVLAEVRRSHAEFDYLILSGDLAQDETLETYQMLRAALGDWVGRCRVIPGNHDDPGLLREVFGEHFVDGNDSLNFALDCAGWRVLGLDSHVPGEERGRIGTAQLDWLRTNLEAHAAAPTVLFIHHPPLPIGVSWLDELGLDDNVRFIDLVARSPHVRAVSAGHVHQESEGRIGAAAVYTTPSTCVQFGARDGEKFDRRAAGYRTFTLAADGVHTAVHRLPA